jgi:hypothetical protein
MLWYRDDDGGITEEFIYRAYIQSLYTESIYRVYI